MAQNISIESDDQFMQTWDAAPATSSADDFSDDSCSACSFLLDSIAKRRRRAVYFHRPPVWYPRSCTRADSSTTSQSSDIPCFHSQNGSSSSHHQDPWMTSASGESGLGLLSRRERLPFSLGLDPGNDPGTYLSSVGPQAHCSTSQGTADGTDPSRVENKDEISLAEDTEVQLSGGADEQDEVSAAEIKPPDVHADFTEDSSQTQSSERPCHQLKAKLCTRLRFYRDIRLGRNEQWAIQEGSLVVGIDQSYTQIRADLQRFDEFILGNGDFYVVCRMYADLWALCLRVSIEPLAPLGQPMASGAMNLAFLPLCAVTLAANFSAFLTRCNEYPNPKGECLFPGNGQAVVPPPRSHSLHASTQALHRQRCRFQLPPMAYQAYNAFSFLENPGVEFVPLDSTLEELFSGVGTKSNRIQQFRKNMSLRGLWNAPKLPESTPAGAYSNKAESRFPRSSTILPSIQNFSWSRPSALQARQRRSERQSSSSVGHSLRRMFGLSEEESDG